MGNFSTVSNRELVDQQPDARRLERDTLIDMTELKPGMRIVDVQSAGGYLTDEVYKRLEGDCTCICVEPCDPLRARLKKEYVAIDNPVEDMYSIEDGSIDVVLGLAGLHHSSDQQATVSEAYRVLKPGGEYAVCDVITGSDVARWLNEFIDRNHPAGHKGFFLHDGYVSSLMETAGFSQITEARKEVPWIFQSYEGLVNFCVGLFGLHCSRDKTEAALNDYLSIKQVGSEWHIGWSLIYAYGVKSATK